MFENQFFDKWLEKKSNEILSKVDKDVTTTEEMLILSLKTQTGHLQNMEHEFNEEFKKIDKRFDNLQKILMWGLGIIVTIGFSIFAKILLV